MADGDMIERKGGQIAFMLSSAALSILCSLVVLLAFFFILWYRPPMANRITLRLIVLSCFCNLIYCLVGLPTTVVGDKTMACRVLIFFMIGADTMASMCLAMVGVHLVVVFVIRAKYPERKEKYYYTFIVASAIITVVVPAATTVGPTATMNTSCWFRYLYVGRAQRTFKWMWYYSWLLLAIIIATICAVLAIVKFRHKQDYFIGMLDMKNRPSNNANDAAVQVHRLPRTRMSTVTFRKVALRCIGYPIIPMISKVWGVAIEISIIKKGQIPYPVFVLDTIFSNLLGFMVSCIFFSDPSVVSVAKESWARLKNYYVDEYFAFDQRLAVVESTNDDDTRQHAGFEEGRKHGMSNMSRIEDSPSPEWTTGARFNGSKTSEERSAENRQPSSISRVDTPERSAPLDDQPKSVTSRHRYFVSILFPCISKKEAEGVLEPGNTQGGLSSLNPFWHNPIIPMHRVIIGSGIVFDAEKNELYTASPQPDSIGSHNAFAAEMKRSEIGRQCGIVEPYEHPHFAKTVHWFLIHICRVKAPDRDGLEIEPRNQPGTNTHRLLNGCSGSFQLRKLQHVDRITSQPVSYISEATSASSATGKTTLDSRNEIKSTAWQATKQPEPMVSRHDIDLKGKAPITSRWDEHTVTNADREPVSSSPVLQPGRDDIAPGKQRLRPRSELVLRVTDPTDQQKEEKVFLLTSADPKDSLGPVGAQGSPRVRRMTADSLPAKSDLSRRAIIHHMWGRSANIRTKRVRRVKDLAGKMGETMFIHRRSSVISNRPRSKSSSRPRSRSISGAFWSPPATPSPPPSPSPGSTPSITCLNFTRLTARPKGHYPKVHPICHVPTQLAMEHTSPTVAKDFGHIGPLSMPESWTSSSPKIPDMARRTQDMGRGFRNAVVSIAYIADGWDDNERDRVHISEVTWDIESLVNELMD